MGRNKTSLSKPGRPWADVSLCQARPDDMITIDWATFGAHISWSRQTTDWNRLKVPLSFKTLTVHYDPLGFLRTCQQCNYPVCDHVRLCDTHYRHTWPPTHRHWHHNYPHALIFIFPEHCSVSDIHMCRASRGWHGIDVTIDSAQCEGADNIGNDIPTHEGLFCSTLINASKQTPIFYSLLKPCMHGGSSAKRKKTNERLQAFKDISFCQLGFILFSSLFSSNWFWFIWSPLLWKTHLYQQILPSHCWGDDIVMLFWYFDTTIKSLADTMTQRWLYRLRDDDGSGRIREKWFRNHFVWDDDDGTHAFRHSCFCFCLFSNTEFISISMKFSKIPLTFGSCWIAWQWKCHKIIHQCFEFLI